MHKKRKGSDLPCFVYVSPVPASLNVFRSGELLPHVCAIHTYLLAVATPLQCFPVQSLYERVGICLSLCHPQMSPPPLRPVIPIRHPYDQFIWYSEPLHPPWVRPRKSVWGALVTDAHMSVPKAPICWLAALDAFGSVLLVRQDSIPDIRLD